MVALLGAVCSRCRSPRREVAERPLRVALHAEPASLDPHLQSESVANSLLSNLYEGLTSFDGEMRLRLALAERWESRTISPGSSVCGAGPRSTTGARSPPPTSSTASGAPGTTRPAG